MQNDDRREQHDIIGNYNSADSGLFALCPGLSRKIIEMTGGYKSHVTDNADFGNFHFGSYSNGKIYVSHCSQKENICRPIF